MITKEHSFKGRSVGDRLTRSCSSVHCVPLAIKTEALPKAAPKEEGDFNERVTRMIMAGCLVPSRAIVSEIQVALTAWEAGEPCDWTAYHERVEKENAYVLTMSKNLKDQEHSSRN